MLVFAAGSFAQAQRLKDLESPLRIHTGDTIVIGFLGGFERWNDESRGIRKLVVKLREIPGVHAESIGNHNHAVALKFIERALDTNHDHQIEPREAAAAHIIILGQSLGGSATVDFARALNARHIPVMLTVQVDSIGVRDGVIPPNVHAAANYFQHDPLTLWGRAEIRAADPFYTRIIGNYERKYPLFDSTLFPGAGSSWARRHLGGGHARMEADEELWGEIGGMVRQALAGGPTHWRSGTEFE